MLRINHRVSKAFTRISVLLASMALIASALTACGSSPSDEESFRPSSFGPTIAGHPSCAYIEVREECKQSGVDPAYWYQMPRTQPANYNQNDTSDVLSALFLYHMIYSSWYSSPGYYDRYVPQASRKTYITNVRNYDSKYGAQEKAYSSRASYKSPSGTVVKGDKLDVTKLGTTKNNGGSRSNNCSMGAPGGSGVSQVELASFIVPAKGGGGYRPAPRPAPAQKNNAPKPAPNRNNGGTSRNPC